MDLSKLPRMSKTDRPPNDPEDAPIAPAAPPPAAGAAPPISPANTPAPARGTFCDRCGAALRPGARFCDGCGAPTPAAGSGMEYGRVDGGGAGPEAWISIAIGVIVLFLYPQFFQWVLNPSRTDFDAITATGQSIPYVRSPFLWRDLGPAVFGVVLLLEGAVLIFARKRALVAVALALTLAAAAVNVWTLNRVTGEIGFPIMSAIAVVYCVYIAMYQWRLLKHLNKRT